MFTKLSEVVAHFNVGFQSPDDRPGAPGPHECYLCVRFMGSSGWTAHLMNVYWYNMNENDHAIGKSTMSPEHAVEQLVTLMTENEVYRLGEELCTRGITLKLGSRITNDIQLDLRAAA